MYTFPKIMDCAFLRVLISSKFFAFMLKSIDIWAKSDISNTPLSTNGCLPVEYRLYWSKSSRLSLISTARSSVRKSNPYTSE